MVLCKSIHASYSQIQQAGEGLQCWIFEKWPSKEPSIQVKDREEETENHPGYANYGQVVHVLRG